MRGCANSLSKLGPAQQVNEIPMPMMKRPVIKTPGVLDAVCIIVPISDRPAPTNIAIRRPFQSARGAAIRAPRKPPIKMTAVMSPILEGLG